MVRKSRVKNKTKRQKGGRDCPDEYPECVEYKSMIPKLSGNYCYNKNSKEYWSKLPDNCELGIKFFSNIFFKILRFTSSKIISSKFVGRYFSIQGI